MFCPYEFWGSQSGAPTVIALIANTGDKLHALTANPPYSKSHGTLHEL